MQSTKSPRDRMNRNMVLTERACEDAGLRPDLTPEERERVRRWGRVEFKSAGAQREIR